MVTMIFSDNQWPCTTAQDYRNS